jgi:hypothetical protein
MTPAVLLRASGLLVLLAVSAAAENIRAGWAKVEITPAEPVMLAGYASRKDLSRGVHDPLSARVIAFEQNGRKLVLISTDNLGFYGGTAEAIRAAIIQACNLQPAELFLCAIHTHSAPTLTLTPERGHPNNLRYTKALQDKLVETTRTALSRLAPVELGSGTGASPVGVNRREVVTNAGVASIKLGRNPSGPCDPEVQVLRVGAAAGEPAMILFGYATHSTSLGPGNLLVSGDVHGIAEQFLEKHFDQELLAPGFAGASGDIDPWYRVLPAFNTTNGWIPETVLMGTMLGEEVAQVATRIKTAPSEGPVNSLFRTLQLSGKASSDGQVTPRDINVTLGRVGDVALVGLGGEIFSEIGKAIKSRSPFSRTFIFTHCNGTAGYVPTAPCYPEGGYEVQTSGFGPRAAEQLISGTLRLLQELKDSPSTKSTKL